MREQLEEERMREALLVLQRVLQNKQTSADMLYLAHELGVEKEFIQDITHKEAA